MDFITYQIPTFIYAVVYSFTGNNNAGEVFVENEQNKYILYGLITLLIVVIILIGNTVLKKLK